MINNALKDSVFPHKATWVEAFAWLPHRCRISKKWIWLKKGYKGTATYYGLAGESPAKEIHWHTTGEHIKWMLTKNDNYEYPLIIIPLIGKSVSTMIAQDLVSVQPMQGIFKNKK